MFDSEILSKSIFLKSVLAVFLSGALLHASWPQWRGLHRNGVATESPPLTTEFGDTGPELLWESFEIPSDDDGGHGSIVVADGHAYLSLVWHRHVPAKERTIDSRVLRKLGHRNTKMSAEKIAAMEKARLGLSPQLRGGRLEEWINQWIETNLTEEEKLHYDGYVKSRFKQGRLALPLDVLNAVAEKKDETFPNQESLLKWVKEQGWHEDINEKVTDAVPGTKRIASDTVLCLDARTGKEVWRFESATGPVGRSASSTPCIAEGRLFTACGESAYCLDAKTGKLKSIGQFATGETPRSFNLGPNNKWLVAAGQKSNDLHIYERNLKTGMLTKRRTQPTGQNPSWVQFIPIRTAKKNNHPPLLKSP